MLDVHLPHGKLAGIKDFFLHLFTITVGLLIALSLEGLVEHEQHRRLAREAEAALRAEITNNEHELVRQRQMIKDAQKLLQNDLDVLAEMRADPHAKTTSAMRLSIGLGTFDNMSWKTAQVTGAVAYMPYKGAQDYADIYLLQDVYLNDVLHTTQDIGDAGSLLISHPNDWVPSPAQIDVETDRIGKVQSDLVVLNSLVDILDRTYQEFDTEHR